MKQFQQIAKCAEFGDDKRIGGITDTANHIDQVLMVTKLLHKGNLIEKIGSNKNT